MCGIAGYLDTRNAASRALLFSMVSAIGHRGPDRFSGFVERGVAMGSARLAVVDLQGGGQPAVSADRQVAIAFNGEIFNYLDLRAEIENAGERFRTRSEVETLLQLYLRYGEGFVRRIKGQFAIAIWDGRRGDNLFLFRDRFGIRPLFWYRKDNITVFGSEIKSLLAHPAVPRRLNPIAVLQTMRFWTVVGDVSPFQDVSQVPAGHYVKIADGGVSVVRYWRLPTSAEAESLELSSDADYMEAFREQFDSAIRQQRMADVPVGSYLSGGIDSTVTAVRLSREHSAPLKTYSVAFDDSGYDESAAQRLVADRYGFEHHTCRVSHADIRNNFPQVVWQAEAPLFRTAPVPLFLLSRLVHEDGVKVVMTGEGADEMLLGYDVFKEVSIRRFWARQPRSGWRGRLLERLYCHLPQYRNRRYVHLLMDFYRTTLEGTEDDFHYSMAIRWSNGRATEGYLSTMMREMATTSGPYAPLNQMLPESYPDIDHIERAQQIEVATLLSNYLLSSQGDRMSMAHGVEGRFPYLDDDFVEFAMRLPRRLKLRGLRDKFVLRNAFKGEIPEPIRNRPKVAYQAPEMAAFFDEGSLPDYAEEVLCRRRIEEVGFFDSNMVEALVAKGKSSTLPRLGMRDSMAFITVLSTMLLDDFFIRGSRKLHSDVATPQTMELV